MPNLILKTHQSDVAGFGSGTLIIPTKMSTTLDVAMFNLNQYRTTPIDNLYSIAPGQSPRLVPRTSWSKISIKDDIVLYIDV